MNNFSSKIALGNREAKDILDLDTGLITPVYKREHPLPSQ